MNLDAIEHNSYKIIQEDKKYEEIKIMEKIQIQIILDFIDKDANSYIFKERLSGRTYEQIAKKYNKNVGALKVSFQRLIEKCREYLNENLTEETRNSLIAMSVDKVTFVKIDEISNDKKITYIEVIQEKFNDNKKAQEAKWDAQVKKQVAKWEEQVKAKKLLK